MKLTAKTIASVKLPDGKLDVIYFDDALPGFGFRMRMSGGRIHRSWIVQYRRAGSSRRYSLGSAEVLSADQARAAAKVALGKVALGGDPQAEKIALRHGDAHTLKTVVDDYLAAKKKIVRPNRYRELNRYLAGPSYFKRLHAMPIDQISRRDVAARLTKITSENGPIVAGCARAALSAFFAWSMAHGLAEQNPVVGTLKPDTGQPRERVLSDPEIVTLWRACGDDAFGKIVKLLLLTGARRSEVCGMRWSEIDMETDVWSLPPERTKNKRAHALPLPPMAMEIIRPVPHMLGRDFLFGERSSVLGFTQQAEAKRDLDTRLCDRVRTWTLHDLRRTAATKMADIGIQPHVIEAVLNHVSGHKAGVAGIYNRSAYQKEMKTALLRWADHIRALIEDTESKVVTLRSVP
jgi:integrase